MRKDICVVDEIWTPAGWAKITSVNLPRWEVTFKSGGIGQFTTIELLICYLNEIDRAKTLLETTAKMNKQLSDTMNEIAQKIHKVSFEVVTD